LDRERKKKAWNLANYTVVVERYPFLKERLDECALYGDPDLQAILLKVVCTTIYLWCFEFIFHQIRIGMKEARRNDTKTLKDDILDWIPTLFDRDLKTLGKDPDAFKWPKLTKSVLKSERGINNSQLAMLLLPWKEASRFWVEAEGMDDVKRYVSAIRVSIC